MNTATVLESTMQFDGHMRNRLEQQERVSMTRIQARKTIDVIVGDDEWRRDLLLLNANRR